MELNIILARILALPLILPSVIIHEMAHGKMAQLLGDPTAQSSGRLSFNPLPHIDFFGTVLVPVVCYMSNLPMFGWAKPVPINPHRLNSPRRDIVAVAASTLRINLNVES